MIIQPIHIAKTTIPWICYSCSSMLFAQHSSTPQVKFSTLTKWQNQDSTHTFSNTITSTKKLETSLGYSFSITNDITFNTKSTFSNTSLQKLFYKPNTSVFKFNNPISNKPNLLHQQSLNYGLFLETDPGETLSKPDLIRGFLKFKNSKKDQPLKQIIIGNYQIQLGEGLTKSNASGFWSSNTYWASKLTDWQIAEKRGFHEGRNPFGVATEFQIKNWQFLLATGSNSGDVSIQSLTQFSPNTTPSQIPVFRKDTLLHYFRSINLSGQHLDSISLARKHNLHEKQITIAIKKQQHFLDTLPRICRAYSMGIASHVNQFSIPYMWQLSSMNIENFIATKRIFTNEIWLSTFLHQGDMFYAHFAIQSPDNNISAQNLLSHFLRNATAFTAGWIIPLSKEDDFSLRYYRIGINFQSWDGLNNHILKSTENITITAQKTLANCRLQALSPLYKKISLTPHSDYWIWQPEMKLTSTIGSSYLSISLKTAWSTKKTSSPNWIFLQVLGDNYPSVESYFANSENSSIDENLFDLNPGQGDLRYHIQLKSRLPKGQITLKIQAIQSQFLTSLFTGSQTNNFLRISSPLNQTTLQAIYQAQSLLIEDLGYEFRLQFFDCDNGMMVGGTQIISSNTLQFVKGKGLALSYSIKSKFQRKNQFGLHFQIVYQQVSITPVSGRIFVTLWQI